MDANGNITLALLEIKDVGRSVKFFDGFTNDSGILKSWNDRFVFVKFSGSEQGVACLPEHLTFDMPE